MKTVLFAGNHPGAINPLIPPIRRMIAERRVNVLVVANGTAVEILQAAQMPFKTAEDFGLTDVSVASMEALLSMVKPSLVIVGTASQEGKANNIIEQTLVRACKQAGIPSVAVLDKPSNYLVRWTDERTNQTLDCLPDRIFAPNHIAYADMLHLKIPAAAITITGNPDHDDKPALVKQFSEEKRQALRQKISLPQATIFYLVGSVFQSLAERLGYWDLDQVQLVVQMQKRHPDIGVVMRLHPRMIQDHPGDVQVLNDFIAAANVPMRVVQDIPSVDLALAADLTIASETTVSTDVVLMNQPVIILEPNLKIQPDPSFIGRVHLAPTGYTVEDCQKILEDATEATFRSQIVSGYGKFKPDGKATDRVVELLYSIL